MRPHEQVGESTLQQAVIFSSVDSVRHGGGNPAVRVRHRRSWHEHATSLVGSIRSASNHGACSGTPQLLRICADRLPRRSSSQLLPTGVHGSSTGRPKEPASPTTLIQITGVIQSPAGFYQMQVHLSWLPTHHACMRVTCATLTTPSHATHHPHAVGTTGGRSSVRGHRRPDLQLHRHLHRAIFSSSTTPLASTSCTTTSQKKIFVEHIHMN